MLPITPLLISQLPHPSLSSFLPILSSLSTLKFIHIHNYTISVLTLTLIYCNCFKVSCFFSSFSFFPFSVCMFVYPTLIPLLTTLVPHLTIITSGGRLSPWWGLGWREGCRATHKMLRRVCEPYRLGFQHQGRPGVAGRAMIGVVSIARRGRELIFTHP